MHPGHQNKWFRHSEKNEGESKYPSALRREKCSLLGACPTRLCDLLTVIRHRIYKIIGNWFQNEFRDLRPLAIPQKNISE